MGIRGKLIGILAVAALAPLLLAVGLIWTLGYRHYRRERGDAFQRAALALAQQVELVLEKHVEEFSDWASLSGLRNRLDEINERVSFLTVAEAEAMARQIDARWSQLTRADAELSELLTNALAQQLRDFQVVCPMYAEILLTDRWGRLVAATDKTSDYWQADEGWWQVAWQLPAARAYLEGVHYDESAGVYSVDVAVPVRHIHQPDEPPAGVIKGVLDASPLFASAPPYRNAGTLRQLIVLEDGRVLASLKGPGIQPLRERLPPGLVEQMLRDGSGWRITALEDGLHLVGFAPLRWEHHLKGETVLSGLARMYAVVLEEAGEVFRPVRRQLWWLTLCGCALVVGFTLLGYPLADRYLVQPIRCLRQAAQVVSASAKMFDSVSAVRGLAPASGGVDVLAKVQQIRTDDELESLAQDFAAMAARVLSYQERLEAEIAEKTAEIQRDLEFARELQEALMPQRDQPTLVTGGEVALSFHHVYLPARTVGGDFFDVLKLDDRRAGIFIADVMGHGARSALVTAMLRALLQDLAEHAAEPGRLLGMLNRQFYNLLQQSRQFIFVSAGYLVVDSGKPLATVALAGHPSPLLVERRARRVRPLLTERVNDPALGLLADATYAQFNCPLTVDDLVLLYTDGIVEARSPSGEEFGIQRLVSLLEWHMQLPAMRLTETIIAQAQQFTGGQPWADDICLVAVELRAASGRSEGGQVTLKTAAAAPSGCSS